MQLCRKKPCLFGVGYANTLAAVAVLLGTHASRLDLQ